MLIPHQVLTDSILCAKVTKSASSSQGLTTTISEFEIHKAFFFMWPEMFSYCEVKERSVQQRQKLSVSE